MAHLHFLCPAPSSDVPSPLQLLKGNTFAGSAFFSYGSFWISWAFFQTMTRLHADSGFTPDAGFKVGECILLATWGFFTFGFFVPTLRKNGCLMTVSLPCRMHCVGCCAHRCRQ
jgi:succinate-acetate transporter protein